MNIPARPYIPHTNSMCLIDTITAHYEDGGSIETTLPKECIFADSTGNIDSIVCIEILAQGFAALNGYTASLNKETTAQMGFLVGVKNVAFTNTLTITTGMKLTVNLAVETRIGDFAIINGTLLHNETVIMTGTLKTFTPTVQSE